MTKLEVGQRYHSDKFFSGNSSNGPWELLNVADDKGKNDISIFPANLPSGAHENCDFVIKEIKEVKFGPKKSKTTDKWFQQCTISAVIEVIKSDIIVDDFDDGPLPWEEGELMDDIGLPL